MLDGPGGDQRRPHRSEGCMSSEASRSGSSARRWRAPVTGAAAGLAVAAAIVGPSALASSGGDRSKSAHAVASHSAAAGGAASPFLAAVAAAVQAGTIDGAQARVLDADIEAGSIDPKALVDRGVLTDAQMRAVSDRLVAVKLGLAGQVHAARRTARGG